MTFGMQGGNIILKNEASIYPILNHLGRIWCWENGVLLLLSESYPNTVKIYIAKYFYVALSDNGQVYRW